jgi:LuxR family maltose regulon positive regulatory protein
VQDFLVRTAVLDRLSGPLCDAVLGWPAQKQGFIAKNSIPNLSAAWPTGSPASSQKILEYLEAANLFLLPLDNERRWYRYHHLFADLLRHRLRQNLAEQIPSLHQRASEWYEQHDLPVEAVDHALAAGAFERAAALLERMGWELLTRGEMVVLLTWLERLPGEWVRSRAQLQIFRAWARALTGRLETAEAQLQEIDAAVLPGEVAAVRAYVAFLQQDSRAPALARRALDLLPEQHFTLRSMMALSLGTAIYWSLGEPVAAGQSLAEAVRLARASKDNHLMLAAISTLGFTQEMRGQLHQAAETHRHALQLTAGPALPGARRRSPPFAGLAHIGLAGLLYEWNDLDGAQHHAREGIALGERSQSVDVLQGGGSYLVMAQIDQARGEEDKALALIRQAKQFAQIHNQAYVVALSAAVQCRLWLAQGQVAAASRWARDRGLHPDDELSYARETEYITLARLLAAQGQTGKALSLLARLLAAAQAAERHGSALKILVLTALTFQAHLTAERALSTLEQALTLAEPEGYGRTFVDEGAPMARLLRQALSEGIRPDYVARLLAAFSQEARLSFSARDSLREPLTERELEVLRLVTAGLSNSEIAEELIIAVSTVKSHINHIFGKLEVESRTQAVAKAQELGLL